MGVRKNFARISQTCPKSFRATLCVSISSHTDHFWNDLKKKSSCDSPHVGRQFFKIKQRWALFLSVFSGSLPRISSNLRTFIDFSRFSQILPGFSRILPGFSTNQNFWEYAWTSCTSAFYTTDSSDRVWRLYIEICACAEMNEKKLRSVFTIACPTI